MREAVASWRQFRPELRKVPSIGNEARLEIFAATNRDDLCELRMQRRLASREGNLSNSGDVAYIPDDLPQQICWHKDCAAVIERVLIAQAIAAVQIADVR